MIHGYEVRFEVFTAVAMKNAVFCYVTSCGSCKIHHDVRDETLVFTRATQRLIPEEGIRYVHEGLQYFLLIFLTPSFSTCVYVCVSVCWYIRN
jgi:hypothetical protein